MPVSKIITSFNAGELSPRLESRTDLEKYSSGCRRLENFVIMPYGGVNRRPGMQWMGAAKLANRKARLIGFNFSVTTNFILEFGHNYLRFWSNGLPVESSPGVPCEIATPFAEEDLFEFQHVQINDVMYLTHGNHPVQKISRIADAVWTISEVAWDYPAFRDENISDATITPGSTTGGGISLVASAPVFDAGNVGGFYQIGHRRSTATLARSINANNINSDPLRVLGSWELTTHGTWDATVILQRSYNGGTTWEPVRSWVGNSDRNVQTTGVEEKECLLRIRVEGFASTTGTPVAVAYLEAVESVVYGVVKITAVQDSTHATADVVKDLQSANATSIWSEGAWSGRRGFPRTVVLHGQRLVFGGCKGAAQTVWASEVNNFETFRFATRDDSAFTFTIASAEQNIINWMVSHDALLIGTSGDEYTMSATDDAKAITPTNVRVRRQSRYGSKYFPALLVNENTLFVQRQGRKVREFVYNFEKNGYVSPDLTLLSEHITGGGLLQAAFQQQPDAIVWFVTASGSLVGMTYERDQNVVGWHRHSTDGFVESVATIYGTGTADEVWMTTRRVVNGATVRYVERFDPAFRMALDAGDKPGWYYLDAGKSISLSPPSATVAGLSHLEGKTVSILADGAVHPDRIVSAGSVTLQSPASRVQIGLSYTSTLEPMPLDFPLPDGTAQGRKFRVHRAGIRFYKSLGGEMETEPGVWDAIAMRSTSDPMGDSPQVFSGEKEFTVAGGFRKTGDIAIRQRQPLPMTVLALIVKGDVYGD